MDDLYLPMIVEDNMSPALACVDEAIQETTYQLELLQTRVINVFNINTFIDARNQMINIASSAGAVAGQIEEADEKQQLLNKHIQKGVDCVNKIGEKFKAVIKDIKVKDITKNLMECVDNFHAQNQAEIKLNGVMNRDMNATPIEVGATLKLAQEEQATGVVSDQLQLDGASQLGCYVENAQSLQSLIPIMNDLAVKQNGIDVTSEEMIATGNMMGLALRGETKELEEVGIKFNEAQQQIMKYGSESERVALLSQVIANQVGNMNQQIANTPQGRLQQIQNTLGMLKESIGQKIYPYILKILTAVNTGLPKIQPAVAQLGNILIIVLDVIAKIVDIVSVVGSAIMDNWSIIEPIIWGIVAALAAYLVILGIYQIATGAAAVIEGISSVAKGIHSVMTQKCTLALLKETLAQQGLNAALFACPLTWIILLVIALIAVVFAVVAAINHFAGTSYSAAGIICGAFMVILAVVENILIGIMNLGINIFCTVINLFISIAEFFANALNDPAAAIVRLFSDVAEFILGIIGGIASAIDTILNTDLSGAVAGLSDKLHNATIDLVGESEVKLERLNPEDYQLDRFNYGDAYNSGYKFGETAEQKIGSYFTNKDINEAVETPYPTADEVINNCGTIADNTGTIADTTDSVNNSISATEEDLTYLRDLAEMEAINRFTTAQIKVEMNNNNTINSELDLDGITNALALKVEEQMTVSAEGVHY